MRSNSVSPERPPTHAQALAAAQPLSEATLQGDLEEGIQWRNSKEEIASPLPDAKTQRRRWLEPVLIIATLALAAAISFIIIHFTPKEVTIAASFGNSSGIVAPNMPPSNGSNDTVAVNVSTWGWVPEEAEPICDQSQGCRGWEGFGSALAWSALSLANYSEEVKAAFMDAVWNRTTGLGLNIVRYSLAGGENPDPRHYQNSNVSHFAPDALLPGFQPSKGVWDWDADLDQRWMLTEAIKRGANLFEMVSSGAPYWMTVSNCSSGNTAPSVNNLRDDMYEAYADYMVEVARFFRDNLSLTFRSLAPLNEPTGWWWVAGNRQEGIFFDNAGQQRLLLAVAKALKAKGLNRTVLTASDDFDVWTTIDQIQYYSDEVWQHVGQLTTHGYGDGSAVPREQLAAFAARKNKRLTQSEYGCCLPNPTPPLSEFASGLVVARQIIVDLVALKAANWIIWQPTWRFIDLDPVHGNFTLRKSYYCFLQFTRFIRPGATIIQSNDADTLAATSRDGKTLTLVIVNDVGAPMSKSFDLRAFNFAASTRNVTAPTLANYTLYRTDSVNNFVNSTVIFDVTKKLQVSVPAGSVNTLVFKIGT